MANKKEKKNALKKMLNEKTLLEMSGGGDLPINTYDNIPGAVKLNGGKTVSELLDNLNGFATTDTQTAKALGGGSAIGGGSTNDFFSKMGQLDISTYKTEPYPFSSLLEKSDRPYTQDHLANKGITGFPLYIADQIQKSTGASDPFLPTGMVVESSTPEEKALFNSTATQPYKINNISINDRNALKATRNNGLNRYLTLYDLITDDDGKFLSDDVDVILNRFSSLAQFKHLPALEYLATGIMSGGEQPNTCTCCKAHASTHQQTMVSSGRSKRKNRSRKVRK